MCTTVCEELRVLVSGNPDAVEWGHSRRTIVIDFTANSYLLGIPQSHSPIELLNPRHAGLGTDHYSVSMILYIGGTC